MKENKEIKFNTMDIYEAAAISTMLHQMPDEIIIINRNTERRGIFVFNDRSKIPRQGKFCLVWEYESGDQKNDFLRSDPPNGRSFVENYRLLKDKLHDALREIKTVEKGEERNDGKTDSN